MIFDGDVLKLRSFVLHELEQRTMCVLIELSGHIEISTKNAHTFHIGIIADELYFPKIFSNIAGKRRCLPMIVN